MAAALTLARAGLSVEVFEGAATPGGGCRTEELTLPGFHHDVCSTIQSMVSISPFFRAFPDVRDAVALLRPDVALAHPLDGGRVASVEGAVTVPVDGVLTIRAAVAAGSVEPVAVSVTVSVAAPTVLNVTENMAVPLVRAPSGGRTPAGSEDAK